MKRLEILKILRADELYVSSLLDLRCNAKSKGERKCTVSLVRASGSNDHAPAAGAIGLI